VNEGLVLLAAWLQWLAVLVVLVWLVARSVTEPRRGVGPQRQPEAGGQSSDDEG
jgi:hypothetical protein